MLFYYIYVNCLNRHQLSLKHIQGRRNDWIPHHCITYKHIYQEKLMSLHDRLPCFWCVHYVTISCPMLVTQVLVTQGVGNGFQAYDC